MGDPSLGSDIGFLAIPSCERDFYWYRRPPHGTYRLRSPLYGTDYPNTELCQTSNDAVSQDNLAFTVLDRIEDCLRRLESYTNKPTMESMRGIIGKIMVEVLGILAIVTKEMKKGRASESMCDGALHVADKDSEQYLAILIGRSDLEDALSRLHKLTQMTRPPTR